MIKINTFILFIFHFCLSSQHKIHPDTFLSTTEIITKYGYPIEIHEVLTEDGYILKMYRIPHGKRHKNINKRPILLMHGLIAQAEAYILNPQESLAYYLADNGFDVWLGNTRGNNNCRKHKNLFPYQNEFWNYSFHEIALYDIPSKIDYILRITRKTKIHYVGHSQGGTVFLIMTTMKPQYQKKIISASLLAPAAFQRNVDNSFLIWVTKAHMEISEIIRTLQINQMPPQDVIDFLFEASISSNKNLRDISSKTFEILSSNLNNLDKRLLPLVYKYMSSSSVKQFLHYAQNIFSGHFRPWDYGNDINMRIYGKDIPDDYPIEEIHVPIAVYYSINDNNVNSRDVENLCKSVKNCVNMYLVPNENWTHYDFLHGRNANKLLYEPILQFFEKFEDV